MSDLEPLLSSQPDVAAILNGTDTPESWHGFRSTTMGHPIIWDHHRDEWFFEDGTISNSENTRPCVLCNRPETPEGHDPCLGTLEGVRNACCGHGDMIHAYVGYEGGEVVRWQDALDLFDRLGVGPLNDREPRSGGSAAGIGASRLHDKPNPTAESTA